MIRNRVYLIIPVILVLFVVLLTACGGGGGGGSATGTITGTQTANYTLSLSVSPTNAGTLVATPKASQYAENTVVTLVTAPASGYKFKSWGGTDGVEVLSNKITMNANKSVTAVFELSTAEVPVVTKYTLSLAVSPSATAGTVTASPAGPTYDAGTVVTLTATPYLGYNFSKWDGTNSVDVVNSSITMNSNKSITAAFSSSTAATSKSIGIDASNDLGAFKLLMGTHNGPITITTKTDATSKYKEMGFKSICTIGYMGPCTWYNMFKDFSKDPELESSYTFATTDDIVNKAVAEGFDVLFNFAPAWSDSDPTLKYLADPPGTIRDSSGNITHQADANDFKKFANVVKHIVMHYNEGWANGYRYNIKKWELWNEPETVTHFWSGTTLQFFQMFGEVSKSLRAYDPNLQIYGPGNAQMYDARYTADFVKYCKDNSVPIDVYTWHSYGGPDKTPAHMVTWAKQVRTTLDANGYAATKSACTEWNSAIDAENFANSGKGAAFHGCALTYMVENDVAESYQYRGDDHPLGMIKDTDGTYRISAYSFIAWKQLTESCTRLRSTTTETGEFAVTASKSSSDGSYYALVSNFTTENKTIKLNISNISSPPSGGWSVTRKVITDTQKLATAETGKIASDTGISYTFDIPSYTVAFIQFSRNQ